MNFDSKRLEVGKKASENILRNVYALHNGSRSSTQHELLLKLSFIFHGVLFLMETLVSFGSARKGSINILPCKYIQDSFEKNINCNA